MTLPESLIRRVLVAVLVIVVLVCIYVRFDGDRTMQPAVPTTTHPRRGQ